MAAGKREYMEDRSCVINDFRPLGTADHPNNAITTLSGVFDGHLSAKAADMAANNLHEHLIKGGDLVACKMPTLPRAASNVRCRFQDRSCTWNACNSCSVQAEYCV